MPKYIVTAAITGQASCEVEADDEESAKEAALTDGEWVNDDWDINTAPYSGGFIDAQVIK